MDSHQLVTVYTSANPLEAEVLKNALNAAGIRCFLGGEMQGGIVGIGPVAEVEVQVPAADADRADRLIRSHERHVLT
jgi:hypothetical protein